MSKGIRPVSDLLADEYAGKILSLTFAQPRCVQEICALTGIPVAVAYRRVNSLEAAGLIKCSRTEVATTGKKSKYYVCQVEMLRLTFREGHFEVEIEWKDRSSEMHLKKVMTS
jgi:predicted transcriptional regulator